MYSYLNKCHNHTTTIHVHASYVTVFRLGEKSLVVWICRIGDDLHKQSITVLRYDW